MPKEPLISIIIPTRNRTETTLFAINNVAGLIPNNDVEVIVHDCSDKDNLEAHVKLLSVLCLRYFHVLPTSMTDNWNQAIDKAAGKYITVIGDDDGITPFFYEAAKWAAANNIMGIANVKKAAFYWPDFPDPRLAGVGRIAEHTGSINYPDGDKQIASCMRNPKKMFDTHLPSLYHGIIHRSILEEIKKRTGKYVDGTCPDFYSAFIFPFISKNYCVIDYPISFYGASGPSNSGRTIADWKSVQKHYSEYSDLKWPSILPDARIYLLSAIAESQYRVFQNLSKMEMFHKRYGMARLYATCFVSRYSIKIHIELLGKYISMQTGPLKILALVKLSYYVLIEIVERMICAIKPNKVKNHEFIAKDIIEANSYVVNYLEKNNSKIRYPQKKPF